MAEGKVRWAVHGAAKIAMTKVIPAMQKGDWSEVIGIASRDLEKARRVAKQFGIPRAYGSYEEALADPEVEAIYNPLPNHLRLPWSIRAAEAGKHVLCEKPVAMGVDECRTLIAACERRVSRSAGRSWCARIRNGCALENWRGRGKSAIYGR
jgi:predicted dehydrogenase